MAGYERALDRTGRVFFDLNLIDAALALRHAAGTPLASILRNGQRDDRLVFLTPPWPDIYRNDGQRRHGFEAAVAKYERLHGAYPTLGYETIILPKASVAERVEFVSVMPDGA